jgi:GAF domain-containing protein
MANTDSAERILNLEPGSHLCCIYETEEDYWAVVASLLRQGLEWSERVLHITDSRPCGSIVKCLRDNGLDVEAYLASGQLVILTCDDVYLQGGSFDPEAVIALLQAEAEQALAEGYQALRVNSEMCWILWGFAGSDRLVEYETKLNESLAGSQCLILCQYDQRLFSPAMLLDVLRTHSTVMIDAEPYENFYYTPPAQPSSDDRSPMVFQGWIDNIVGRRRAEEALRRAHDELEMRVEDRTAQLRLLNDIGGQIAAILDLDGVLDRAVRLVQEGFGYHHVALFTVDHIQDEFVMRARAGDFADLFPPDHRLRLGQGMVGWVGYYGETLLANDVSAEPRYVNLYPDLIPTRSELCVPIGVGGELVGVLDVQSPRLDAFDENDVMVMETLADQIAVAVENARLYETVRQELAERKRTEEALARRVAQLALLNDIGGKIAVVLELDSVLERAACLVQKGFGYHHVALFTLNRERSELVMRARAGDFADLFPLDHQLRLGQGMVGWVGYYGKTLLANDVSAEPRYVNLYPDLIPTRSELSVPLGVGGELVGVLDVQSPQLDAFDENDVMVMETLADQIAVAIENARLYEAVQRELVRHRRV